jgi:hypothetical protein
MHDRLIVSVSCMRGCPCTRACARTRTRHTLHPRQVRPLNDRERDEGCRNCISFDDATKQVVLLVSHVGTRACRHACRQLPACVRGRALCSQHTTAANTCTGRGQGHAHAAAGQRCQGLRI